MSQHLDKLLAQRWKEENVAPAQPATDAEFMRRVYLDLTGVTPSVFEAREFLADKDPAKRRKLVDRLLSSPAYATHMATTWRTRMLPAGFDPGQLQTAVGLQNWLREQFVENLRYDNLVAEFLVASGTGTRGPGVYYTALELKPEKLAASTARIFLGLQIQCAQCHDHPFDHWTQRDFWGYAAFFARLQQPEQPNLPQQDLVELAAGEVTLPESEEVIAPKYPSGRVAETRRDSRRVQLSIWMASRDNPYLARAAVNWAWAHMFGRGIVNPVDDLGAHNPPSHPQLLDDLGLYFTRHGFDLKELLRVIAMTEAYQLSSVANDTEPPPEFFARMAVKTLTPAQLYDSLGRTLVRREPPASPFGQQQRSILFDQRRRSFISRMSTESRDVTEYEQGLPQALMLMNGPVITEATNSDQSALLASLEAPFFSDKQRLEVLFLATLSRLPTEPEQQKFLTYLKDGGPTKDSKRAASDVLWALLNSGEFAVNH
jgi:hypothetical protein